MGIYWMLELMPLAVTALIPTIAYPMLGILTASETCYKYLSHISFLFMGGLIMALAVEKSNLHQRVALRVLTIVGSEPHKIMLGFMSVTAFLSMWISNTATTAMMMPIAQSIIMQLIESGKEENNVDDFDYEKNDRNGDADAHKMALMNEDKKTKKKLEAGEDLDMDDMTPQDRSMAKGFLLSICFAANIGGTGTLTGTPPNLVLIDLFDNRYKNASGYISFLGWMQFAIPLAILQVISCWLILAFFYLPVKRILASCNPLNWFKRRGQPDRVTIMMRQKYQRLPPISFAPFRFAEVWVLILFGLLLALWIFRDPQVIPGFGMLFKKKYYSDATSAMLIAVILFVFPSEMPDFFWRRSPAGRHQDPVIRAPLMDWPTMQHKFPWSVIILLGGGFALAAGVDKSGLSKQIGVILEGLDTLQPVYQLLLCLITTVLVTNVCSNTVTAVIFVQIVAKLAENSGLHPLRFMAPCTLSTSLAFMLPVGTPPNAIVFASGSLKVSDMIVSGSMVTVVTLALLMLHMQTYAFLVFPLATYPEWAPPLAVAALNETAAVTVQQFFL